MNEIIHNTVITIFKVKNTVLNTYTAICIIEIDHLFLKVIYVVCIFSILVQEILVEETLKEKDNDR